MIDALDILAPSQGLSKTVADADAALDTNVLLCPYRLSTSLSQEYLQHLASLQGRLFVPYRVAFEFERRRGSIVQEQDGAIDTMVRDVQASLRQAAKQLHEQHRYFPRQQAATYLNSLGQQLQTDIQTLKQNATGNPVSIQDFFANDPIAATLETVLAEQIAPSYAFDEALIQRCRDRFAAGRPPGSADTAKNEPDCYGDAFIWLEVLDHARTLAKRGAPLVMVTGDFKPDWWVFEGKWRRSPRFELVQEIASTGLQRFAMLSPREFFEAAGCTLSQQLKDALRAVEK